MGHFRDQGVEEISENYGDRYRNQDWLKKANDVGHGPDHCADDDYEQNYETSRKRRPHGLALPRRGVFLHVMF